MTTASSSIPASSQLAEALLEVASAGVLVVDDVSWRVVAASGGAERLYGGPLVGHALENLFRLDAEQDVARLVWRAEKGERVEVEFERSDGAVLSLRVRAHRLALAGCTVSVLGLDDVTRERQIASALETVRSEQRALVDALGIGVVALDTSGRVLEHNRFEPLERAFGAYTGRNFFLDIAVSPESRAAFQRYQAWAHAIDAPAYRDTFEFDVGRALVEAELHAGAEAAGPGALVRLADVTDRRAAEQALRRQTFEAEEAARRTRLVYQTASLIHRSLDLDEVFETAAAETGRLLGASRCQVLLVGGDGEIDLRHEYRRPHLGPPEPFDPRPESSPTVAEALRALHALAIDTVEGHPLGRGDAMLEASSARAAVVAPIAVRREARGALVIAQCDRARRWTTGEVELAASIGAQVGLAIGHVEIHERVRRQAEREAVVGRLAVALHAARTLEAAFELAARVLVEGLDASEVAFCYAGAGTSRLWAWRRTAEGLERSEPGDALRVALDPAAPRAPASGTIVARFATRDGHAGAIGVAAARHGEEARALADAVAVHLGVAAGTLTLLEAVTSAKQVWEGTFDAMSDGIVLHDDVFRIVRVNRAFARLVRAKPAALVGTSYLELFGDENRPRVEEAVTRVSTERRPLGLEVEEPGLGRTFSISVARLETESGPCTIHTVRDVSREREMHERLAQSAKMASIGHLAAGVAHEINTPLATISGSAQSLARQLAQIAELREGPRWEAISERLEAIVEQAFRCKRITHDLLDFAAPTRAQIGPADLVRVVRDAVESVERTRPVGRVTIRERGAQRIVATDAQLVGQVVINLVTNGLDAVEARGAGSVTVEVRHLARESRVSVKDTGDGIAPAELAHVFDPFYTTKPPGRGTGLGLSISQNLVASLGGRLTVQSREGRGSTFTIHLPRAADGGEG